MSSELLKQAIIDSEALKEAAVKNAQKSLSSIYNPIVEQVVTEMLENDEEEVELPFAFDDDDEEIDIDLTSIDQNDINESCCEEDNVEEKCVSHNESEDEEEEIVEEKEACEECGKKECVCKEESEDDEEDLKIYEELLEVLQTDLKPHKRGFINLPAEENIDAEKEALATVTNDEEEKEEFDKMQTALKKAHKEEINELKQKITKSNGLVKKYQDLLKEAFQCLEESNIIQAKLVCQNKALMDTSLNEQQKKKIVESVGKVKTAKEVELVYETLYKTFENGISTNNGKKRSLNEILSGKSNKVQHIEESKKSNQNPAQLRMLKLCGIIKEKKEN